MFYDGKPVLRMKTCWQCKNMGDTKGQKAGFPERCQCQITKRWGKLERGYYCDKFEYRQWHNAKSPDGILIKNRLNKDYRTKKQWENAGRKIKNDAIGLEMYASKHNLTTKYKYYLIEETEEMK